MKLETALDIIRRALWCYYCENYVEFREVELTTDAIERLLVAAGYEINREAPTKVSVK